MNISKPEQVCLGLVVMRLAAAWVVCCLGAGNANACGLDWSLPINHFDGVDEQGHVSYWENIGEVDCGDGLVLPLHINFNSKRDMGAPSPYLGQGWLLPLLECKFVQENEDRFVMIQPDGLNNLFLRAEPNGTVLNGSAGWKGEIKGDTITAWASCGWRIMFTNGRIASMTTPKGRQLDWVYEGGKASELREGGIVRLKVEYGVDRRVEALTLPLNRRILLIQADKPRVQTVQGQNVIVSVDNTLSRVMLPDGYRRNFTFGSNEKMFPTLEVGDVENGLGKDEKLVVTNAEVRQVSWDPQTKIVVRDGDWIYQVTQATITGENAAIGRINSKGQKEFWYKNDMIGQETTQGNNGAKMIKYWYNYGKMAGKLNKIVEVRQDGSTTLYKAAFDSAGSLIRQQSPGHTITYTETKPNQMDVLYERELPSVSSIKQITYLKSSRSLISAMFYDGRVFTRRGSKSQGVWSIEGKAGTTCPIYKYNPATSCMTVLEEN